MYLHGNDTSNAGHLLETITSQGHDLLLVHRIIEYHEVLVTLYLLRWTIFVVQVLMIAMLDGVSVMVSFCT